MAMTVYMNLLRNLRQATPKCCQVRETDDDSGDGGDGSGDEESDENAADDDNDGDDDGRQLVSHAEVAAIHDAHYARLASAEGQRLLAQLRAGAQDQARDFRADRRAEKRDQ